MKSAPVGKLTGAFLFSEPRTNLIGKTVSVSNLAKIAMTIAPAVRTPNNAIFCTFIGLLLLVFQQ